MQVLTCDLIKKIIAVCRSPSLEIVFQEQSYFSLHSGQSLARNHFCGIIADPCGDWWSPMRQLETVQGPIPISLGKNLLSL